MAIYHCSIKIIGRSGGRTAVASAAYRSGEKLLNEETGITHDFTRKGGIVMSEILLPANAPDRYLDRQTLWNEVQKVEKRADAQLARDDKGRPVYDPSLPSYNPKDKENTSKYRIPVLDENGNQKTRKRKGKGTEYLWERISIPANDWNEHSKAEEWRKSWAEHCNQYLTPDKQIDHRSYKRQGLDIEPTIHEGVAARQIEQRGDVSDRCDINRNIKERNSLRRKLKETFDEITAFIIRKAREIYGRYTELRRHTADTQKAGRDDKDVRRTAGRDRQAGTADFGTDAGAFTDKGTTGRILGIKRGLDERKQAIDRADYIIKRTESEIADTDRHLEELSKQTKDKENDHDERIRKLKERRRAYQNVGGNAGRTGQQGQYDSRLRETASDISEFLSSINVCCGQAFL